MSRALKKEINALKAELAGLKGASRSSAGATTTAAATPVERAAAAYAPRSGVWSGAKMVGGMMRDNLRASTGGGLGNTLKAMGGHAIRGAVWGGAINGTISAAQGGDFWAGAKEGAWNGAVAWTGYRMLGRATGATSLNPLSKNGAFRRAATMYDATSPNAAISKPAQALLRQQAGARQAKNVTGG